MRHLLGIILTILFAWMLAGELDFYAPFEIPERAIECFLVWQLWVSWIGGALGARFVLELFDGNQKQS